MKTIIELATKAGWVEEACIPQKGYEAYHAKFLENLTRFATLVEAAQIERLTAGVEMPKPVGSYLPENSEKERYARISLGAPDAIDLANGWKHVFTADQMRDYAAAAVAQVKKEEVERLLRIEKEIDLLCANFDALRTENERLQTQTNKRGALAIANGIRMERAEAENERLREVLEQLAKLGNGDRYGNSIGNEIAQVALKGQT